MALAPEGGAGVSYADLDRRSDALAAGLASAGGGDGAVVALLLASDASWVVAAAACSKLGAAYAGINPRATPRERDAVLARLRAEVVLDGDAVIELTRPGAPPTVIPPPNPERTCAIVFTSGTTGEPKGAEFRESHLDAIATIDLGSAASSWGGGGPMLASTQFAHIGFSTKLPSYLRTGARIHLLPRWRAADALAVIAGERMASIGGVAAQIGLLLRVPDFDTHDVSALRTIVVGAGPSPAALVEEARRRFGADYSIRYSSTESGGCGTGTAFDAGDAEALHTVGRPRPGVEVRVDPDTSEVQLRSGAVMAGYWNDPERTAAAFTDDGWLRTGDLGAFDEDGLLHLTGRASDVYIRGGDNVHPLEVEGVLLHHPAIAAVAIVPRDDSVMGEVGVAVVVPLAGLAPPTLEALRSFAAPQLASYKLPEGLRVVDELPLTTMDKVDRRALRAMIAP